MQAGPVLDPDRALDAAGLARQGAIAPLGSLRGQADMCPGRHAQVKCETVAAGYASGGVQKDRPQAIPPARENHFERTGLMQIRKDGLPAHRLGGQRDTAPRTRDVSLTDLRFDPCNVRPPML